MNSRSITQRATSILSVAFLLAAPSNVLAWGPATHEYLAKQLGHTFGYANTQEMYGGALPDFPNLLFASPHQAYLFQQTHYDFMKLVDLAPRGYKKALAFGFASHNEDWGADYTAHLSAVNNPGAGYVPAKVAVLSPLLEGAVQEFLEANGITPAPGLVQELSMTLADTCVEAAVDILVSQSEDENVGARMVLAAGRRAELTPVLLTAAYAGDLANTAGISYREAASIIKDAESQTRIYLRAYGMLLSLDNRLDLMAELIAQLAEILLAQQYGITVDVPASLTKFSLEQALVAVKDDYAAELAATLEYVREQLQSHGIGTSLLP